MKPRAVERIALALILALLVLAGMLQFMANASPSAASRGAGLALPADSRYEQILVSTTGGAGTANGSANGSQHMWGYVKAIHVNYTAGLSTTTDITITTGAPAATIMVKADSVTDAWYYPSVQFTGPTGAAVSGAYGRFPIDDYVAVTAGQSSTGTITVTVFYGQ